MVVRLLWLVVCRAASRKLLGGTFAFLGVLGSGFLVKSVQRLALKASRVTNYRIPLLFSVNTSTSCRTTFEMSED